MNLLVIAHVSLIFYVFGVFLFGNIIMNMPKPISDDPFEHMDRSTKPPLSQYSDISDDDYEIPCSQKRLPRWVD